MIIDPTLAVFATPASYVSRVFIIAGSDNGDSASIQTDLRTLAVLGCYGMSVIIAITAQNVLGVMAVKSLTPDIVTAQIDTVAGDIGVDAARTGILGTPQVVEAILFAPDRRSIANLVVDSVTVNISDVQLGSDAMARVMAKRLSPCALLVTPNLPEASAPLDRQACIADDMLPAACDLLALGSRAVLLKGRYLVGASIVGRDDVLQDVFIIVGGAECIYTYIHIDTPYTHGIGCTLSAATTAHLARGDTLEAAIGASLDYLLHAIDASRYLAFGQGVGPSNCELAPRPLAAPRSLEVDVDED